MNRSHFLYLLISWISISLISYPLVSSETQKHETEKLDKTNCFECNEEKGANQNSNHYHTIVKRGLDLGCQSTWDTFVYKFNVTLSWTVSDIDTSQISHFTIVFFKYSDNTFVSPSLFTNVDGQNGQNAYSYTDSNRKPYPSEGKYSITIHWNMSGPSTTDSCQASLEPPSPSTITTINIVSYTLSVHTTQEVQHTLAQVDELLLNWVTPESANAQLSDLQYEIWIGINDVSPEDDDDLYDVENVTKVDETQYSGCLSQTSLFQVSSDFTHLYLRMRCFYQVDIKGDTVDIISPWSDAVNFSRVTVIETTSSVSSELLSSSIPHSVSSSSFSKLLFSSSLVTSPSLPNSDSNSVVMNQSAESSSYNTFTSNSESTVISTTSKDDVSSTPSMDHVTSISTNPEGIGNPGTDQATFSPVWIVIPIFIVLILVAVFVIICIIGCIIFMKSRRFRRRFKTFSEEMDSYSNQDIAPFFKGRSSSYHISPVLLSTNILETHFMDEWELPAKCVIVNQHLGEGCFGEVFKGVIRDFTSPHLMSYLRQNKQKYVAIKVLKENASNQDRNDFLKEIELMKKIAEGNNPHVVNMIGAVTLQEPMCVVTEFVEYGDLLSYLRAYRKKMRLHRKSQRKTQKEAFTDNKQLDEEEKDDKKSEVDPYIDLGEIESVDLVSFAYQISSGMEYLASLSIVHRDLACRNVLVGDGKMLKITDFGLSRKISHDSAYVKATKGQLPLKWMAIESIIDREFTTASDVWSFGITLWEIGTLGGCPYPTISNQDLLTYLSEGCRMEKPQNCSQEIYQIMLDCWNEESQNRPTFTNLRHQFDVMLSKQKNAYDLYIDLAVNEKEKCYEQKLLSPYPPMPNNSNQSFDANSDKLPEQCINVNGSTNVYVDSPTHSSFQEAGVNITQMNTSPTNATMLGSPSGISLPLPSLTLMANTRIRAFSNSIVSPSHDTRNRRSSLPSSSYSTTITQP